MTSVVGGRRLEPMTSVVGGRRLDEWVTESAPTTAPTCIIWGGNVGSTT